jgi:hypothetical protein
MQRVSLKIAEILARQFDQKPRRIGLKVEQENGCECCERGTDLERQYRQRLRARLAAVISVVGLACFVSRTGQFKQPNLTSVEMRSPFPTPVPVVLSPSLIMVAVGSVFR